MKRVLVVLFVQAVFATTAAADDTNAAPPHVTLSLAWDGYMRPGHITEAAIRLLSRTGGTVRLLLQGGGIDTAITTEIDPGVPRELWIPIRPSIRGPVTVYSPRHAVALAQTWYASIMTAPATVAIVSETGLDATPRAGVTLFNPPPAALPRTAPAYDTVDVVVLDGNALSLLDAQQKTALTEHLRACGKLIAIGLSPAMAARIKSNSGCHHASLSILDSADKIDAAISHMLSVHTAHMPTRQDMESLIPGDAHRPRTSLILFCTFYVAILVIAVISGKRPTSVALIPLAAVGIAYTGWGKSAPQTREVQWFVTDAGDTYARYRTLMLMEGSGKYTSDVKMHPGAEILSTTPDTVTLTRDFRTKNDNPVIQARIGSTLLSRTTLTLGGTLDISNPLQVHNTNSGVEVVNTGKAASLTGILQWHGDNYRVPTLQPGGHWRPVIPMAAAAGTPATTLLKKYDGQTALLVPFTPPEWQRPGHNGVPSSWLLITAARPS